MSGIDSWLQKNSHKVTAMVIGDGRERNTCSVPVIFHLDGVIYLKREQIESIPRGLGVMQFTSRSPEGIGGNESR